MHNDFAIGLFRTLGAAQDVRARLVHEGVSESDIELRPLAREAVLPPGATQQTMVSFLDWLFGNDMPERYGMHITNGETAVGVRCASEREIARALAVMRLFAPLHVERAQQPAPEGAAR